MGTSKKGVGILEVSSRNKRQKGHRHPSVLQQGGPNAQTVTASIQENVGERILSALSVGRKATLHQDVRVETHQNHRLKGRQNLMLESIVLMKRKFERDHLASFQVSSYFKIFKLTHSLIREQRILL